MWKERQREIERQTLKRFWRRVWKASRSLTISEWEWSTWRLRSSRREEAMSLRSVMEPEVLGGIWEGDLKRAEVEVAMAMVFFLRLLLSVRMADFGDFSAVEASGDGVSRSFAAEVLRVRVRPPLFFISLSLKFLQQRAKFVKRDILKLAGQFSLNSSLPQLPHFFEKFSAF